MYEDKETLWNKIASKPLVSYSYTVHEIIKRYKTVRFGIVACYRLCALVQPEAQTAVVPWLIELPSVERSILKEHEQS